MTGRIRWEYTEGGMNGYVGTLAPPPFTIHCANLSYAEWMLTAKLPGDAVPGNDLDALKAEAERWLEEFAASIGAAYPEDTAVVLRARAGLLEASAAGAEEPVRGNRLILAEGFR